MLNPLFFQHTATTLLGGLNGFLFSGPLASTLEGPSSALVLVTLTALGFLVGFRKRESKAFFYLSLLVAVTLISVIGRSAFQG